MITRSTQPKTHFYDNSMTDMTQSGFNVDVIKSQTSTLLVMANIIGIHAP